MKKITGDILDALIRAEALLAEVRDNSNRKDWREEAEEIQPVLFDWLNESGIDLT